jgi:16S rRNA (guanine1207-N2)-methyltransferase
VARTSRRRVEELLLDEGVLSGQPVVELGGWLAVEEVGGMAVLPWRGDHLAATEAGVPCAPDAAGLETGAAAEVVVHQQKSRAGLAADLALASRLVTPGGRILLLGNNELGITSAVKRVSESLGSPGIVLTNRARARVVAFPAPSAPLPAPEIAPFEVEGLTLASAPGVFSAGELDPGSALLLDHLRRLPGPKRIADPGAGVGVLGLVALRRWPKARVCFGEADHRALECLRANLRGAEAELGSLEERAEAHWWDASERWPGGLVDMVLLNPPHHSGKTPDLSVAERMIAMAREILVRKGTLLLVANRQLPYEALCERVGTVETWARTGAFKLLAVERR